MQRITYFIISLLFWSLLSSQTWEDVAPLPNFFQTDHSFGFALDGKGYLVTGSTNFVPRDDFFQYDPEFDIWLELDPFPGSARGFAIGDVWENKAYLGFGRDAYDSLNDLWVFDPVSQTWEELASCPCPVRSHPSFIAHNGFIYVGFGSNSTDGNLNDFWAYDIANDSWEQKPDIPGEPRHHPYHFAIGDYVYTGLGHGSGFISKEWFRFDPSNDTWMQMNDFPGEARVAGNQFSFQDVGYVISGDGDDHYSMEEGEFWSYEADSDSWTQLLSHPGTSRWAPATFVLNNEVYLINGSSQFEGDGGQTYKQDVFKYRLAEQTTAIETIEQLEIVTLGNTIRILDSFEIGALYNVAGERLKTFDSQSRDLNTQELIPGIYLLSVVQNSGIRSVKFSNF